MDKQQAQKMCKLDNDEYISMTNTIFNAACACGPTQNKTCDIILGADETMPGLFTKSIPQIGNNIFFSKRRLYSFHPFYNSALECYPNDVREILNPDINAAYADILVKLLHNGYDITLQDALDDYNYTLGIIEFVSSYGYRIRVVVNKKRLYESKLEAIKAWAIKAMFSQSELDIAVQNIQFSRFIEMLKQGNLSELVIYDNFLIFTFEKGKKKVISHLVCNRLGEDTDFWFDKAVRDLREFINKYQNYISEDDLNLLIFLLEQCARDFYERIDFSLLSEDNRAR